MITRSLNNEERINYNWKFYPLDITATTTKESIISFINSKLIKTNELAFDEYPVYIDTLTNDIVIIDNAGNKQFTRYDHIYKGNVIKIEINGNWTPWNKAKKNIKKIVFMDNLVYHESAKDYWSEGGFSFSKFYSNNIYDTLKDNILKSA